MGRPNRVVLVILITALAVSFAAPRSASAFGGLEIAAIVISGVMAIPLAVKAIAKLFKNETTDDKANGKPAEKDPAKLPPITVSPDQIYTE